MPKIHSLTYGPAYRRARKLLLASNPPCYWCGGVATTADHEPPVSEVGRPHLNLVPACVSCNSGRQHRVRKPFAVPPSRDW